MIFVTLFLPSQDYTEGNKGRTEGGMGGGSRSSPQPAPAWAPGGLAKLLCGVKTLPEDGPSGFQEAAHVLTRMWTEQSGWPPLQTGVS